MTKAAVKFTYEPVQPMKVRAWCLCGGEYRRSSGEMFRPRGRLLAHVCVGCGSSQWLDREYPYVCYARLSFDDIPVAPRVLSRHGEAPSKMARKR